MPEPATVEREIWDDLEPLLDQALSRLPDIYRAVIVLCDLEDKTRKEAARHLGLPEGTVGSRSVVRIHCKGVTAARMRASSGGGPTFFWRAG